MPATPAGPGAGPQQLVEIPFAGQVVHHHRGDQQRRVGDAIHRPDPQAVAHRRRPLVKERHQQRRRETDQLPAGEQVSIVPARLVTTMPSQKHRVKHEEAVEPRSRCM